MSSYIYKRQCFLSSFVTSLISDGLCSIHEKQIVIERPPNIFQDDADHISICLICAARCQFIRFMVPLGSLAFRTFAVRETDVSRHNGGTSGAPLKPLRDNNALRALSSLRGLRGAPEVPPLCRETSVSRTANVGTVGMNGY